MPRSLSAEAVALIANTTGLEPINIIAIQWTMNGGWYYYADKNLIDNPEIQGKILSIDGLESVVALDRGTTTTSVKVELDDTDGTIKTIFDNNDIHNRTVEIYQWFGGINGFTIDQKFLLFDGQIASPIEWDEGARTFKFDVITQLINNQVGFTVEDGQFSNIPDILLGKEWPLIFGTAINVPCVQMDEMPTGTTMQPLSIPDPNISAHLGYIDCKTSIMAGKAACLSLRAAELMMAYKIALANEQDTAIQLQQQQPPIITSTGSGSVGGPGTQTNMNAFNRVQAKQGKLSNSRAQQLLQRSIQLQCQSSQMLNTINNTIAQQRQKLVEQLRKQQMYATNTIYILNGELFLQGQTVAITIDKAVYTGVFNGSIFTIQTQTAPDDRPRYPNGQLIAQPPQPISPKLGITVTSDACQQNGGSWSNQAYWACDPPWNQTFCLDSQKQVPSEKFKPFFAQAGSSVKPGGIAYDIEGNIISPGYPIRYIITIVPGTEVLWLSAMDTVGVGGNSDDYSSFYNLDNVVPTGNENIETITTIPPEYYSISTLDFDGIIATIATIQQPLSTLIDQHWKDKIYATCESPIGPNIVDIMIWVIQTYTVGLSIDPISFNYVRSLVDNYPANFALLEKKDVHEFLKDIAWQSRCSIWLSGNTFYLKYLPDATVSVSTITESDIEQQTLVISTTNTEDLVTKMVAKWRASYDVVQPYQFILNYNASQYGLIEKEYNFYIYNTIELVQKSATFWFIRLSNVWKTIKCKCMLTQLIPTTMDNVTVSLSLDYDRIANVPVVCFVEKATLDTKNFTIDFDIWTPVRLGEMSPYIFAYPYNIPSTVFYPTIIDEAGGFVQAPVASGDLGGNPQTGTSNGGTRTSTPSDQADSPENNGIPPVITSTAAGSPWINPGATIQPQTILGATANTTNAQNAISAIGNVFSTVAGAAADGVNAAASAIFNAIQSVTDGATFELGTVQNFISTANNALNDVINNPTSENPDPLITSDVIDSATSAQQALENAGVYIDGMANVAPLANQPSIIDYDLTPIDDIEPDVGQAPVDIPDHSYPGQIIGPTSGGNFNQYDVMVYPNGIPSADGTNPGVGVLISPVTILNIVTGQTIPANTWGYIIEQTEYNNQGQGDDGSGVTVTNYYFQPAVYVSMPVSP